MRVARFIAPRCGAPVDWPAPVRARRPDRTCRTGVSCRPASLEGCGFGEDVLTKDLLVPMHSQWQAQPHFRKHLWTFASRQVGDRASCAMAFHVGS